MVYLLPDNNIIKVLCSINSDNVLKQSACRYNPNINRLSDFPELEKLINRIDSEKTIKQLEVFFKVKNILFSYNGKRRPINEIDEKMSKKGNEKYSGIKSLKAGSSSEFIAEIKKTIPRNDLYHKILFDKTYNQLYTFQNFENIITQSSDFTLTENIEPLKIKKIVMDLFFIKKYIRNVVNHAAEEPNKNNKELNGYFESCGYHIRDQYSVIELKQIILSALDDLNI